MVTIRNHTDFSIDIDEFPTYRDTYKYSNLFSYKVVPLARTT